MILVYTILLTTTLFFLGSRARITQSIWSRYPRWLERFMDCAMCTGAWYGIAVAIVLLKLGYHYPGLDDRHAPFVIFLASAAWTPIVSAIVQWSMEWLGAKTALSDEELEVAAKAIVDLKDELPPRP